MRHTSKAIAAGLMIFAMTLGGAAWRDAPVSAQAQAAPGAPAPAPPPAPAGGGRGGADGGGQQNFRLTFPAAQRPPGDPALIARGKTLYDLSCRLCHGADLRGGDMGGPSLLRSELVLNDQKGELILPLVRNGRARPGMPSMPALGMAD